MGKEQVLVDNMRTVWLTKTKITTENARNTSGKIIYWMWRDQRVDHNWALLQAQQLAQQCNNSYVSVVYLATSNYLQYSARHFDFILKGLKIVENSLFDKNIPFHLMVTSNPVETMLKLASDGDVSAIVSDFTPLKENKKWTDQLKDGLDKKNIPFCQVDAHNIVPCRIASEKCEYAARTIRRKIMGRLDEFLTEFPSVAKQDIDQSQIPNPFEFSSVWQLLVDNGMDTSVKPVEEKYFKPGCLAGHQNFSEFCKSNKRLGAYSSHRNNPNYRKALSNMSPYFHFGQVSVQQAVIEAKKAYKANRNASMKEGLDMFIEEAVVRRELSDNFCYYNKNYDSLKGAYPWALLSLAAHVKDKREYVYSMEEFAAGETHDDLWNSAQMQLVHEGKMHGFLRMYWAKKVLEWTPNPKTALEVAQTLNDRYALDGNDPNGFVGVGWSVMGIHDQGWREREVFGKIRYMNYAGCKRKFDVQAFVNSSTRMYKSKSCNIEKKSSNEEVVDTTKQRKRRKRNTIDLYLKT